MLKTFIMHRGQKVIKHEMSEKSGMDLMPVEQAGQTSPPFSIAAHLIIVDKFAKYGRQFLLRLPLPLLIVFPMFKRL